MTQILDTEMKTYEQNRDHLTGTAEGKFVLIHNSQVKGAMLSLVSPSGMVETPRLQAKHVCHSEAEPKNLNALTETLRFAQGDSLGGGFERVGFQPTCIKPLGLKPRVV